MRFLLGKSGRKGWLHGLWKGVDGRRDVAVGTDMGKCFRAANFARDFAAIGWPVCTEIVDPGPAGMRWSRKLLRAGPLQCRRSRARSGLFRSLRGRCGLVETVGGEKAGALEPALISP
jgi:hypothetical protein